MYHLNFEIVENMYDLLMFSGDLKFASAAAEMIYNKVRVCDQNFINWVASHYWSNRRNMIFHESLETTYSALSNLCGSKSKPSVTKVCGTLKQVGLKGRQEVVLFEPEENFADLTKAIFRNRYQNGGSSNHS